MPPSIPINSLISRFIHWVGAVFSSGIAAASFVPDFKLKPDDFTVLMGVDAELNEDLRRVSHSGHGKFQVAGWTRADQSATWKVTATEAAAHEVFLLVKRDHNQPLAVKLDAAGQSLRGSLPANPHNWQHMKLQGLLELSAGESTLSLRLAAADGKTDFSAEVHAVELVRPDVRKALHQRALAMRADSGWFQEARYGMMVHWTKQSMPLAGDAIPYEQAVAEFDVEITQDGHLSPESLKVFQETARCLR